MVLVLGGVGKLMGTVVAAFCIGLSNKLIEPAIGGTAAAVYAKVAVLMIVIWFLQWRPTRLFARRGRAAAETAGRRPDGRGTGRSSGRGSSAPCPPVELPRRT